MDADDAVSDHYRSKRVLDLAVLGLAAVPAGLIGLGCAAAIKLTSRGPVLFRQTRVGHRGQHFEVYKFRSMVDGPNPVVPEPGRITRVGAVLRRWSLDELPQLLNVAKGDMSVVGPRPTLGYQVDRYTPEQSRRLAVRPGMTGHAQVNGRNALSWAERIAFDIDYVERQSLRMDLSIIARTAATLLSGDGVEGHEATDPLVDLSGPTVDLDPIDLDRIDHTPAPSPDDRSGPTASLSTRRW